MSKMVERVARAMCALHVAERTPNIEIWKLWVNDARAAIAAMREPTEAMTEECWGIGDIGNDGEGGCWIKPENAAEIWHAMIDEALK